jgi:hypothetical protein
MSHKKSRLGDYNMPIWLEFVRWCLRLPRLARIVAAAVFALAVTLVVSPMVDYLYLRYFYTDETRVLPSLVTAAFGILVYFLGWWLLVGTAGEPRPARPAVLVYVTLGIIALCLVIVLAVSGFTAATSPV